WDEIERGWSPSPAPAELADWVASLVADGTLGATVGADGRARFCVSAGRAPEPQVTLDSAAFDRAIRHRDEVLDDSHPES
ncbi:MAG: hypothetical protein WBG19_08000, partial [Thermoplasmata archaeon]